MRREGHFLKNVWFKGKWGDEYLYAILKEEWQSKCDTSSYMKRE
jgi:RimJ/RimL family protein N-acetyltransferase